MALSDLLTPRLVELGSIKIGTLGEERQKRGGNGTFRLPKKLDHFLITTKFRDTSGLLKEDERLMESLQPHADSDGHIREIPIAVLSDEIDDFLRCAWVHYQGKKCFARSDGVRLWWYYDRKTGELYDEPKVYDWKPEYADMRLTVQRNGKTEDAGPLFKKHTSFDCIIATAEARWGGIYRFRTTSTITGDQLYGSLLHIKSLTGGILRGMPLRLCVRPMNVAPEGKPTTVYVCYVDLLGNDLIGLQNRALEIANFQRDHQEKLVTLRREMRQLMHDPGIGEDDDTQADMQQEFHPEQTQIEQSPSLDDLDGEPEETPEPPKPRQTNTELFGRLASRVRRVKTDTLQALRGEVQRASDEGLLSIDDTRTLMDDIDKRQEELDAQQQGAAV